MKALNLMIVGVLSLSSLAIAGEGCRQGQNGGGNKMGMHQGMQGGQRSHRGLASLNLTPEQVKAIDAITDTDITARHTKINEILTPEQKIKFAELIKNRPCAK